MSVSVSIDINLTKQWIQLIGRAVVVDINRRIGIQTRVVDIIEDIAGVKLKRNYLLDAPKGVNGRNSDNTKIKGYFSFCMQITRVLSIFILI